jgi:hydrogenase-4 component E
MMPSDTYTSLLDLAVGVMLLCAVGVVWGRRLRGAVRLIAVQGAALAAIPLLGGVYRHDLHLLGVGVAVGVLRAAVLPGLVTRLVPASVALSDPSEAAAEAAGERHETAPLLGTSASLLLAAGATVLAYAAGQPLVALDPSPATRAAPVALAVILIGVLLLVTRRRAVSQIVGFLTLDNGIAAVAFLLTSGVPVVVELGGSFDLLLFVLVTQALTARMRVKFGGTDLGELQGLHE